MAGQKTTTTKKRATSRKAPQKQAKSTLVSDGLAPVESPQPPATKTKTPRKKSTGAKKKTTNEKPRTSSSRKKPTLVAKPAEIAGAIEPIEDKATRDFEPALEATPAEPRKTDDAEQRAELFSDLMLDTPSLEVETEIPPDDEETLERPAIRKQPPIALPVAPPVTPTTASANGHVVVLPERDLDIAPPETPRAPFIEEESIPDTPLPSIDGVEETALDHIEQDELFEPAHLKPEQHNGAIAVREPPPLLRPIVIDAETLEEIAPTPAPVAKPMRFRVALVLLLIIALCIIPFWRDVNAAHLYLYSINPLDGHVRAQQDLGSDYTNTTILTNPVLLQSSLLVGLPGSQHILSLSGGDSAWSVTQQIDAPLTPQTQATLSVAPNHDLVVAYAGGTQVLAADGSLLWQIQGVTPSMGAHAFSPAIDTTTLYTVKDASKGVIAAYNLNNGSPRWSQQLNDTLNHTPPMLLSGDTVFVAGDHTIYALDRADGSLLWKAATPARTLLIEQAAHPLLIAAGATGLMAFDAQSGAVVWAFSGHPGITGSGEKTVLTNAQFYQASLAPTNQVVYATGIVWDEQQTREQLWLFAVDASSGAPRWSEQVGSGLTSADAGRILTPFIDATQGLVLLEIAQGDGSHMLAAYDTASGSLRWSMRLAGVTAFTPTIFQAANDAIGLFAIQSDEGTALHLWSLIHLLWLALSIASILLLLGLWIVPLKSWGQRTSVNLSVLRRVPGVLFTWPGRSLGRKVARLLITGCLGAIIIGAGTVTMLSISRPQQFLNAVVASSGVTQWQRSFDAPASLSGADGQESFVVMKTDGALSVLTALNTDGSVRWSTPASEGVYSLPSVQTAPGTLLVALSGPTSPQYTYAPNDPGYPQLASHLFSLLLLDSATGHILWQTTIIHAGEAQHTVVLGADSQYTYLASRPITAPGHAAVVQLIAINTASGTIAWRIYGPHEDSSTHPDFGALLPNGRLLIWQIASTVYALDTRLGQIQWRAPIAEANTTSALLEESQMTLNAGVLLIRRSDKYHALDPETGHILWSISGLGFATPQSPGGMLLANGAFILYGSDTIEALDPISHSVLWQHSNLVNISDALASPDGSLVYAIVFDNQESATTQQALVAFDVKDSSVRWTFQPPGQALFTYPGAPQLRMAHGMLYVTTCMTSGSSACHSQIVYGLDAATGSVSWKFGANQVTSVQVSQDGSAVVFQTSSSIWDNFKASFQG